MYGLFKADGSQWAGSYAEVYPTRERAQEVADSISRCFGPTLTVRLVPPQSDPSPVRADPVDSDEDDEDTVPCVECDGRFDPDRTRTNVNGEVFCEDCYYEAYSHCEHCDDEVPADEAVGTDDGVYCESCADRHWPACCDCGDRHRSSRSVDYNGDPLCEDCYCSSYSTCDSCGDVTHYDAMSSCDNCHCSSCCECDDGNDGFHGDAADEPFDELGVSAPVRTPCVVRRRHSDRSANSKGFFGRPILGKLPIPELKKDESKPPIEDFKVDRGECTGGYFGVELEIEVGRDYDREDKEREVTRRIGSDFVEVKDDGSLNYGFELVTAPASLDVHRERFADLLGSRIEGLRAWSTETAGMHVHYSRAGISAFTLAKLNVFLNAPGNRHFTDRIAGREPNQYCNCYPVRLSQGTRYAGSRYRRLNLANSATIEFRMFRSTLKYSRVMANLEFCAAAVAFCRDSSPAALTSEAFIRFIGRAPKAYPALSSWMKEVGILAKKTVPSQFVVKAS